MRRCLVNIVLAFLALPLVAQPQPPRPLPVTIDSKILGETRTVLIRTPESYSSGNRSYPVLYMTDGDRHIDHTAAVADFLAQSGRMPETIIVGIVNTNRNRDLTPTKIADGRFQGFRVPASGGADRFLDFIASELIPHVEKKYRTLPYRVFAGHSFGGLLGMHTAFTRPSMFNAVIAVSPTLNWDNRYVHRRAAEYVESNRASNATLVFSVGNEGAELDREFDALRALLEEKAPKALEWSAIRLADEDHGSVVLPTHYTALKKVFEPFRFPIAQGDDPKTLYAKARDHFARTSARAGFTVAIPEATTNVIGYRLLQTGDHAAAIDVFRKNVAAYPQSANVYDSLAEAYERSGDLESAKQNYAKAASIGKKTNDANTRVFEQNLARVTAALK